MSSLSLTMPTGRPASISRLLREAFPAAGTTLERENAFQLLIAIVLSAQATDVSVNKVTPALFARYPDAASLSRAREEDVLPLISSVGLAPTKTRRIIALSRVIASTGLPTTKEELMALPGVGNKTAGVYLMETGLGRAFPVDTHVGRIALRLGLTKETDPTKVEADLEALFPATEWRDLHHRFLSLGRTICHSRNPSCASCPLHDCCDHAHEKST